MAQGLSGEAVKGDPMTTVIPGVDESKVIPRAAGDSTEPLAVSPKGRPDHYEVINSYCAIIVEIGSRVPPRRR